MKKNLFKISILPIIIGFIIFIFTALALVLSSILSLGSIAEFILILVISLVCGIVLYGGIFILSPSLAGSVLSLRQMNRFESLSHPLLLKLSYQAPGTYHHSLNVSILAQKAAKAVGADTLILRLGSYYHDIGKLESPMQYIENQSGSEIPQADDADSIRRNAKSIIAHVENGVKIAESAHLPSEVIDLIAQHHGTTKTLYFYEKAKEKGLKIKKTDFKYGGPRPQSKEAVILMLADSCEASARAVIYLTPEKIRDIVENAMEDKMAEDQFADVKLSISELTKIRTSLIETLGSIYHQRILFEK